MLQSSIVRVALLNVHRARDDTNSIQRVIEYLCCFMMREEKEGPRLKRVLDCAVGSFHSMLFRGGKAE